MTGSDHEGSGVTAYGGRLMTRHRARQSARRTTTALGAALAAAVLLAGCGGTNSSAAPDKAETPQAEPTPRAHTFAELKTALPRATDVTGGLKITARCPDNKNDCYIRGDGPKRQWASVTVGLRQPRIDELTLHARTHPFDWSLNDDANVTVSQHPDDAAARAYLTSQRVGDDKLAGDFDEPVENIGKNGFVPGRKGHGKVADAEQDGWTGYSSTRTAIWRARNGSTSPAMQEARVFLRAGRNTVSVSALMWDEGRSTQEALELARQVVEDYLERLG